MNKIFFLKLVILFGLLAGCSVTQKLGLDRWLPYKTSKVVQQPPMSGPYFAKAGEAYGKSEWKAAAQLYVKNADSVGGGKPQIDSFYFAAESFMMLGNYEKAEEYFRLSHLGARRKFPKTEVLALYRKSYAQEEQNKDPEALASLLDVLKRRSLLPNEVSMAELPSRIAGIYARLGKLKVASKYYDEAEDGLNRLKANMRGGYPSWYTKTLYYMGATSLGALSSDQFDAQLKPLRASQKYLLQAVESQNGNWSQQAYRQLLKSYDNLFRVIRELQYDRYKDLELAKKKRRDRQAEMAIKAKGLLNELRLLRLPKDESSLSKKLFSELEVIEKKYDSILFKPGYESELTPASKSRLKKVKTINPDEMLENNNNELDPNL